MRMSGATLIRNSKQSHCTVAPISSSDMAAASPDPVPRRMRCKNACTQMLLVAPVYVWHSVWPHYVAACFAQILTH